MSVIEMQYLGIYLIFIFSVSEQLETSSQCQAKFH